VKGEKLTVADEALKAIAAYGDRGFRDGLKVRRNFHYLQRCRATKELVEKSYKTTTILFMLLTY